MSEAIRPYPRLSACGLNCGLCPRYHTEGSSRCPGCGGPGFYDNRPKCGVVTCMQKHGVGYCFQCGDYPCSKFDKAAEYDSFISHQNMFSNFQQAKEGGIDAYMAMLDEKVGMLCILLDRYNDGRKKSFFCQAVNLLGLEDVRIVMDRVFAEIDPDDPVKERSAYAATFFKAMAEDRGVDLKLKKKAKKK